MKKILIIGDTVSPYHPLNCVFPLSKLLSESKLTFTNDYDFFTKLTDYDLLIGFVDAWFKELEADQANALLSYLDNGGKILSIHTGMSIQATEALAPVHGAKFIDHPPYCSLTINLKQGHPLTEGIGDFTINDEPYQFEVYDELDIFASYEYEGTVIPAAWRKNIGQGELVYLMPGHDEAVFENEEYLKLIKKCVEYLI
ncbi:MAG: ThuA domain-containing protein [Lachnospiraceae bacterium]|jgi:type 1 glutamine amidotransferase|nr:ThuA domain-containing protein [Lachnospiraceae bacterium]